MSAWSIDFYTTELGAAPVRQYLDELSPGEFARIARVLLLLEEFGVALRMPHAQKLESSDLWELRVRGNIQHRIFYVAIHGRRLLLLHAFTKKSQRAPVREIRTAEQRLKDYLERFPQ